MAAVSSKEPTSAIHGGTLLKAIRTVYNIFLLSKSPQTQIVAQASLTQMVQAIFGRVPKETAEGSSLTLTGADSNSSTTSSKNLALGGGGGSSDTTNATNSNNLLSPSKLGTHPFRDRSPGPLRDRSPSPAKEASSPSHLRVKITTPTGSTPDEDEGKSDSGVGHSIEENTESGEIIITSIPSKSESQGKVEKFEANLEKSENITVEEGVISTKTAEMDDNTSLAKPNTAPLSPTSESGGNMTSSNSVDSLYVSFFFFL